FFKTNPIQKPITITTTTFRIQRSPRTEPNFSSTPSTRSTASTAPNPRKTLAVQRKKDYTRERQYLDLKISAGGISMPRVAFVGAGSYGFTLSLVVDILSYPALENSELVFMDVDEDRLGKVKTLITAYYEKKGLDVSRIS